MAQEKIKMNGTVIAQPDEGLGYSFETTTTSGSGRVQSGKMIATPMFTVEQLSYTRSRLTTDEMKTILQIIAMGKAFTLHYYSPYYGLWRDAPFRVDKGSLRVGCLSEDGSWFDELTFNMTGVNPI